MRSQRIVDDTVGKKVENSVQDRKKNESFPKIKISRPFYHRVYISSPALKIGNTDINLNNETKRVKSALLLFPYDPSDL